MINLYELALETAAKVPGVIYKTKDGSRALEAVDYIENRKVSFWGTLPSGVHKFIVNGYEVYFEHDHCECRDHRSAPQDDGYRWCKHMLAVKYSLLVREAIRNELLRIILMAQRTDLGEVMLESRVYFAYDARVSGGIQENELLSYRIGKLPANALDEALRFYNDDLHAVLLDLGWMVRQGRVGGTHYGGKERWVLCPQPDEDGDLLPQDQTRIWRLDGESPESRERKLHEAALLDMFDKQFEDALFLA